MDRTTSTDETYHSSRFLLSLLQLGLVDFPTAHNGLLEYLQRICFGAGPLLLVFAAALVFGIRGGVARKPTVRRG